MLATRHLLARSLHLIKNLRGPATRLPTVFQLASKADCSRASKRHAHTGALLLQESDCASQPQLVAPRIAEAAPDYENMMLRVTWEAGGEDRYPFIWMRDNCLCPDCLHPFAKNRQMSIGALLFDISPTVIQVSKEGEEVEVRWSDDHVSCFTAAWLQDRTLNTNKQEKQSENFRLKMEFWGNEKQGRLRRFSFPRLCSDDKTLLTFLEALEVEGVAVINDIPCQEDQFKIFSEEKIGYVRPTHYGEIFSVRSKNRASNVAYTSGALDMHNDMVYLEEKPAIQIMHCISQTKGQGGEHLLVDSFQVATQMRDKYPELFRVLTDTLITFTDVGFDAVGQFIATAQHPVIQCDGEGIVTGTNISNHSRGSHLTMTPEDTITWYKAYITFRDLLNDPKNYITNKLQDGEMVVLDNYRVLHGRKAYQESEGERHMISGYWDWDIVKSKRRVLRSLVSNSERSDTPCKAS